MYGEKSVCISLPFALLKKRFLFPLSIVSLFLVSIFPLYMIETSMGGHMWVVEYVDTTSDYVGYWNSIEVDSLGRPHISYAGEYPGGDGLKYAHWNGVTWDIEVVDHETYGYGTSLALDSFDCPHISYGDGVNDDLRYAHWDGSGWEIEVVDSLGYVGTYSSLDLDSQGRPHITYGVIQNGTRYIRYAYWNGVTWNFHDLDYPNEARYSHLVLDSLDTPHMSFWDTTEENVMYAKWDGSDWLVELVDGEGSSGERNSIALDSFDRPHIAYDADSPSHDEVRYASWDGTNWTIENAWVGGSSAYVWLSLDIDSQGNPGIPYATPAVGHFFYIWKSDGKWYNETINPIVKVDVQSLSFTFDQMDFPHISYARNGLSNLLYITVHPPPLPDLTLSQSDIGFDPSSPVLNGTSVNITAAIRNIGGVNASGVDVRFYDGRPPSAMQIDGDQNLGTIPSLSSSTASVQWTASPPGIHEICVFADPDDTIVEFNETNNMACRFIEVFSSSIPEAPTLLDAILSGWNLEDVTLKWNLSPDDGEGSKSVSRYDVYRGTEYDPNGDYSFYDSVPNGTSTYVDVGAGEGNPSNYFYYVCAVNAVGNSSCSLNQAGKFTRLLNEGPNLISIPLIQSNESTEKVLQTVNHDKAWTYDSFARKWKWYMEFKPYKGVLTTVDESMGLWINVTKDCNFTIAGIVPHNTTIHLKGGWNLVSFPSFEENYTVADLELEISATRVEGFSSSSSPYYLMVIQDTEKLGASFGYWIKVPEDTLWLVSN